MEKSFVITKEMIEDATSYMPIWTKEELARDIAERCIVSMPIAYQNEAGQKAMSLPTLKKEDCTKKAILLLNTFLGYYFNIDITYQGKDGEEMDARQVYDYYAGSHLFNQLERHKADSTIKNKVFDILSDYRDFEKMVNCEIANIKANNNDTLARFSAYMQLFSTPENVTNLLNELKNAGNDYKEMLAKHKITKAQQKAEMKAGLEKVAK